MMKKYVGIFLIICMFFVGYSSFEAKTLADLRNELAALEQKQRENESSQAQTEAEIQANKNKITSSREQINKARAQIQEAEKEIKNLNKQIKEKQEETKELIRFLQIANGENSYLEYIFGATSMSDLINRLAIVEQISNYNDELIAEMNALIDKNVALQKKLEEKQKELEKKIEELAKAIQKMNGELKGMGDIAISLEAQVKAKKEQVDHYVKIGCKEDQDITTCLKIPTATGFVRPLSYGIVTSRYANRTYYLHGKWVSDYHYGIDLATGDEGYNVYASAPGTVSAIFKKQSCGGNMVYIDHIVNGVNYSTAYYHLKSIKVKLGDTVFQDTVIGTVGGGPSTWGWDSCSTGAHLHFGISKTHFNDYYSWVNKSIDPEKKISFPSGWFYRRY